MGGIVIVEKYVGEWCDVQFFDIVVDEQVGLYIYYGVIVGVYVEMVGVGEVVIVQQGVNCYVVCFGVWLYQLEFCE